MHRDRHAPVGEAGRLGQPKDLLEAHGQDGRGRIAVVERAGRAAGDDEVRRREAVERGALGPLDPVEQGRRKVEAGEVGGRLHPGEVGAEPVVEGIEQRGVGEVGPGVAEVVAEEADARLGAPRRLRPRQQASFALPNPFHQRRRDGVGVGVRQRRLAEPERPQPLDAPCAHRPRLGVPRDDLLALDLSGEVRLDLLACDGRREEHARLARPRVEVGDGEEGLVGERVVLGQPSAAAVAEAEGAGLPLAPLGDPVRVGEGQEEAGVFRRGGTLLSSILAQPGAPVPRFPSDAEQRAAIHAQAPEVAEVVRAEVVRAEGFLWESDDFQAEAEVHVGRAALGAEWVAFGEEGGEVGREVAEAEGPGAEEEVGEARVEGEVGEGAAVVREPSVAVERVELAEEGTGLGIGALGRRVEPGEFVGFGAPGREVEGERREVGVEDLGRREGDEGGVLGARPEPVAHARRGAAGAAPALVGRGARDADGREAGHPAARVEARRPRPPGVHDDADALQRQARLGDVGRQHDLALPGRGGLDGPVLRLGRERAVERCDEHAAGQATLFQPLLYAPDLARSRQKDEKAARLGLGEGAADHPRHVVFHPTSFERAVEVARLDGKLAALARDDGCALAEETGDGRAVERGAHDEDSEVGAEEGAALEREREAEVGREGALVELVEDDEADAVERGVGVKPPRQHALGDDLDARAGAHARVQPHPVPDRLADALAQRGGHAAGGGAGGEPTGFQHDDPPPCEPGLVEQRRRNARRFARTGRSLEHGAGAVAQRPAQRRERVVDGERRQGGRRYRGRGGWTRRRDIVPDGQVSFPLRSSLPPFRVPGSNRPRIR